MVEGHQRDQGLAGVEDVFLVIHTGHADQKQGYGRPRGASRLEGWPDASWYYSRHPDSEELRLLRAFGRDVDQPSIAVGFDSATRRLTLDETPSGPPDKKAGLENAVAQVVEKVRIQPGINKTHLLSALGRHNKQLKTEWIDTAIDKALVRVEPGPNSQQLHYREQVAWVARSIVERSVPAWHVGDGPRHPSRWQRWTSHAHPGVDFADALRLSLVPATLGASGD